MKAVYVKNDNEHTNNIVNKKTEKREKNGNVVKGRNQVN